VIKSKCFFGSNQNVSGFYPAYQSNLKSTGIQKALIGWKKATFVLIM